MSNMPKVKQTSRKRVSPPALKPAALAGEYLRGFTTTLAQFSEFDTFVDGLKHLIAEDVYFKGQAELSDTHANELKSPDFESLKPDETVIPLAGTGGNRGYLKYSGKKDGKPFGAEDLHLMGAIAAFVAELTHQAEKFRLTGRAEKLLQYLINQLPLGVICFSGEGQLIIQNKAATRLLGEQGSQLIEKELSDRSRFKQGRAQLHFEVGGKLIYSEGRVMELEQGVSMTAYVLYDMSSSREKLLMDLEREAYRSEARGGSLTLVLLHSKDQPGQLYRQVKQSAEKLQIEASRVQPLDALTCACVYEGKSYRTVRYLLKQPLYAYQGEALSVSIMAYEASAEVQSPARDFLERAHTRLLPIKDALLPELLVMDAYPSVAESLEVLLSDDCRLHPLKDPDAADELIRSGRMDGVFVDIDAYTPEVIDRLRNAAKVAGGGFRFYYTTFKKASMVSPNYGISRKDILLQKPFDTLITVDAVKSQFDLA